jgi:FKBP-type peptidyl-prolyl cis-trans isomerase FkpA
MNNHSVKLSLLAFFTLVHMIAADSTHAATTERGTLYSLGAIVAKQLSVFNLSSAELEIVKQGLSDVSSGKKPEFELTPAMHDKVQDLARTRRKVLGEKMLPAYQEFLEKASHEKGAVKTDSGLVYIPTVTGVGPSPLKSDTVKVNYRGTLIDGKEFDSSFKRGKPSEFRLDGVISCWTEGLQKMKAGGKARLVCPAKTAYGDTSPSELILPGATLVFEIDLIEIKK